jgi:YtoQ family protein
MTLSSATTWNVYLSGEIHSDWRERITAACRDRKLPVAFSGPVTDHDASDHCATYILGEQPAGFWRDHASASINAIRTRTHINAADVVVIRFAGQYREWNAAFDAGLAAARDVPIVTLHEEDLDHALKEVDAAALATARTPDQVVDLLDYVINQK